MKIDTSRNTGFCVLTCSLCSCPSSSWPFSFQKWILQKESALRCLPGIDNIWYIWLWDCRNLSRELCINEDDRYNIEEVNVAYISKGEWRSTFVDGATLLRMLRLFHQLGRFVFTDWHSSEKAIEPSQSMVANDPCHWNWQVRRNTVFKSTGLEQWMVELGPRGRLVWSSWKIDKKNYKRYDFSFT